MKVLLVNGFSPTAVGIRAFHHFETAVRNVVPTQAFQHQKFFLADDIEFTVVDSESLSVYLYELNTGFLNKDAEKLFDHLDMIFIDGDASLLPWFGRCGKVTDIQFLILIRMCKKTGKVLFGCTFAMQVLTFLCATNLFISRIVNGDGKGTALDRLMHTPKEVLRRLDYGEMFLDSATGDIYSYDQAKGEFYPIANASIHHHKTAQENRRR